MGTERTDDFIDEVEGGVNVRPAGVAERLHPVSTHFRPGQNTPPTPVASAALETPPAPTMTRGTANTGGTSTATMSKTEAIQRIQSQRLHRPTPPAPECGQLTMVRNGACEKCDSCGATSGCS